MVDLPKPLSYRIDFIAAPTVYCSKEQALVFMAALANKGFLFVDGALYPSHQVTAIRPHVAVGEKQDAKQILTLADLDSFKRLA